MEYIKNCKGHLVREFQRSLFKNLTWLKFLAFTLLLTPLTTTASNSYAQSAKISLNMKNVMVKDVLSAIEDQSEFYFTYSLDLIDDKRKTTIKVDNLEITSILARLFKGLDVKYKVNDRHIVLYKESTNQVIEPNRTKQQEREIKGTVKDGTGGPVSGASIVEKGTSNGVSTDKNGNFTIVVAANAVLQISYIGFSSQEVMITTQNSVEVILAEDQQSLEQVVVVGCKKRLILPEPSLP